MKKKICCMVVAASMVMAMVTGCGGSSSSAGGENGELNVFVWTEYVPDSVISGFEEETGIKVNVSTFSSNEDMLAKVKSEDEGAYDIIQPSDYMVEQLISQDMLEKLDSEQLTNIGNIGEAYLNPSYDPTGEYSVPYLGGVAAIAVNTDKITEEVTSYDDLFNPAFADSMVVLDDFRAVIGMTERSMGYSMSESDPTKLEEVKTKLLTLKENIKLYDSDSPKSALISGDCDMAYCWSAEIALAMEENPSIQIVYPEEGAYLFLDNWSIPKGAKNYDNAMKFINYMLDAETSKAVSEEFPYLNPNDAAIELLGSEYSDNEAKNPPADVISNGEFIQNLDNDTLAVYDQMWTELKK
ncbi:MAG: spermidine/putrescine ABC transporter substrate-binding protein [Lachnospiraceae bacterium]|nr:spermidine/putrescine ABC transporter substrate-binding protein [Lachnospiraceae bacterium]MDD3616441.1 spermidine/putrescine ABC transporter substrate-binding protein [Lachnospiraceae bacterium]